MFLIILSRFWVFSGSLFRVSFSFFSADIELPFLIITLTKPFVWVDLSTVCGCFNTFNVGRFLINPVFSPWKEDGALWLMEEDPLGIN